MSEPTILVTRTTRTEISVTLSEDEVVMVLREWAAREHGLVDAEVVFDIAYDGYIRDVLVRTVATETQET